MFKKILILVFINIYIQYSLMYRGYIKLYLLIQKAEKSTVSKYVLNPMAKYKEPKVW